MTSKPIISAAIIARNAEKSIVNCLNSIKDYCSEIIIAIDTRTTDETKQRIMDFAGEHNTNNNHKTFGYGFQIGNVKVYYYEWVNDSFADARNFTLSKCTGDWILCIDCDEQLTNIEQPDNDFDCLLLTVRNYRNGIHVSDYFTPRLFKNNIGIHFRWDTDEENWHCIRDKKVKFSSMFFEHREKSEEAVINKAKWLLSRNMKSLPKEPDNPYLRGQIAHRHLILENIHKCIYYGTEAMVSGAEPEVKALQCIHLYRAYRILRDEENNEAERKEYWDHAVFWLKASVSLCPQQLSANALFYDLYKEDGNTEAMNYHKKLIDSTGNNSQLPYDVKLENLTY